MPLARVVTFEGVSNDRMAELKKQIESTRQPENVPASELVVLHDPDAGKSLAIVFFATEEDYRRGSEALEAMPVEDTPGKRTSIEKYEVTVRMSN
jgi:hypothetical protein